VLSSSGIKVFRGAVLLAGLLLLAACVTTEEHVFTEKPSPEKARTQRVELARQYIGERNWADAKRNLKIAYEIDPKDPEVHEAYALLYQSTGEFELAEGHFKSALRYDKKFSRARNNYAVFLYGQERYREAEEQLELVVKDGLYTGRPNAFTNLGLCRLQLDDTVGAEEAFRRALTMDRSNSTAWLEVAHLRFEAGDIEEAGQYYGTYQIITRPQSARGLLLGIRIAQATGDRDAEGSYALALSNMYPKSPEYEAYRQENED